MRHRHVSAASKTMLFWFVRGLRPWPWPIVAAVLFAVACGGGSDDGSNEVPPTAKPSVPGPCADPLARSQATSFYDAALCLWKGPNAPQRNVANGAFDPVRVAVVRGRAVDVAGIGLAGVRVTVLGHPEFGETTTRDDGLFDMAVAGGATLTARYEVKGRLPVARQAATEWRTFTVLPDAALIEETGESSSIDPASGGVATGARSNDASGERHVSVIVSPGTRATMRFADGRPDSGVPAPWHVRLTEYTQGERGPLAMPSDLPASSAYTYATEFSVDEARNAGAASVAFDPPVVTYVDNFLHFKAGTTVPAGHYDADKDRWEADDGGIVVDVLSTDGGLAALDANGDGLADAPDALAKLGITEQERRTLARERPERVSLWRVPMAHFSAWDLNWGFGPPPDAIAPRAFGQGHGADDCKSRTSGSIIGCDDQTLGETLPLAGVPHVLHYQSERAPGRADARTLDIAVTPDAVPPSLARVELEIEVLGQITKKTFPPSRNQTYAYAWDGKDVYGRTWQGRQAAHVKVGFVYAGSYSATSRFGASGATTIEGDRTRQEITLWSRWRGWVGGLDAGPMGLGGFSLDVHHVYDPMGQVLYLGDGRQRTAEKIGAVITTVAGPGESGSAGDGGPATRAQLDAPHGIVSAPDGTIFVAEDNASRVRKITPDGTITTYAGTGKAGFSGDGGPATQAALSRPMGLALGRDGTLFVADAGNARVRAISPGGIITTIAGGGEGANPVDGGRAVNARFSEPHALAIGRDGTLFVVDSNADTVRRIDTSGILTTIAGGGSGAGENVPATSVALSNPLGIAIGPSQEIYVTEWAGNRVRRIDPSGLITTVIGLGTGGSEDGALAKTARIDAPHAVDVAPDGSLYITEEGARRVRRVTPDGRVETMAGGGNVLGDDGPPLQARFSLPRVVFVHNDGSLWVADYNDNRIRRIRPSLPPWLGGEVTVASEDGGEIYAFDAHGKHLRTVDTLTRVTLFSFGYSAQGLLEEVRDRSGNATRIEHDSAGHPTAVVGPYGARTTLTTNADGWLASARDPAGGTTLFEYAPGGLLTSIRDGADATSTHRFDYDANGRLVKDIEPSGAFKALGASSDSNGGARSVSLTSRLGRTSKHETFADANGLTRRYVAPSGLAFVAKQSTGKTAIETPTHTAVTSFTGDPRFGMLAPFAQSLEVTQRSSATKLTVTRTRDVTLADASDPLSVKELTATETAGGRTRKTTWNAAARTLTTRSPEARTSVATLDALGRITQLERSGWPSELRAYDDRGRLGSVSAGGRTTSFAYDGSGHLQAVTDPLGRTQSVARDAAFRPTTVTLPDGAAVSSAYDASGRLVALTPPGRPAHGFEYASFALLGAYVPPAANDIGARRTTFAYDGDDALAQTNRADGRITHLTRDASGRLAQAAFPEATLAFTYDAATGKLTRATRDTSTMHIAYVGDLPVSLRWTGPVAGEVARTWENDLLPLADTVQGTRINLTYDGDGLLTKAGDLALRRDTSARVTGSSLAATSDAWTFDASGAPASYAASGPGGAAYRATFTRDLLGRITRRDEAIAGDTHVDEFSYDVRGRLSRVSHDGVVTAIAYDANSNRTGLGGGAAATFDAQDRIVTAGAETFAHGANGERTRDSRGTFAFDTLGNLTQARLASGVAVDYVLDAAGRRIGRKRDGALVQGFLYRNALEVVAELDGAGNTTSVFVYGARHVPEAMLRGGVLYRIVSDERGSPRVVLDAQTGVVAQAIDYDVWGAVTRDTNPGFQPFGFAGGLYDRDTGFVRFGARDYDPRTARWLQKDPSGLQGGVNLYAYGGGDPVNTIDRDGRNPILVGAVVGGAAGFFGSAAYQYYTRDCVDWGEAAGWGLAGAAAGALVGVAAEAAAASAVEESTTTLYRAVSEAELKDIGASGGFRGGAGSMGNKWFAESAGDAAKWGKEFYKMDGQPFYTVRVQVPNSIAGQLWRTPMLDSIGPARSAEGAVIDLINNQGLIDALTANAIP